jgi:hypothetical protein
MAKSLKQLKAEGKPPEMKPDGTHPGDTFIYKPKNAAYHEWYYSEAGQKLLGLKKGGE